jgi:phosphatidylserine/phosphatidylglycerophosphate/cardiolipin synthase-like enzyme
MANNFSSVAIPRLPSRRRRQSLARIAVLMTWACMIGIEPAAAQDQILFPAADNALASIVQRIKTEQVRLDIAAWLLVDGDITTAILNKHRAGVPVRLIGDRASIFEGDPNTRASFELLASNGVPIRLRYHPTSFPEIIHWKCGIFVGQRTVEFGSANWTTFELAPWSSTNFKDETAMFTSDSALVEAFLTQFDVMWVDTVNFLDWPQAYKRETGQDWNTPMQISRARLVGDYPTNVPGMVWSQGSELVNAMIAEIDRERQSVDVVVYRLTVPALTDALIRRHRDGVPVRVFVEPTQYRNPSYPEYELTGAQVDRLLAAGVPIKQRLHEGLTHMKTLITSAVALNGSSNFTRFWQRDHNYFIPASGKPALYSALKGRFNAMWNDVNNYTAFQPQPPEATELVAPGAGATIMPFTPRLEWKRARWAVAYDIYLGTSPSSLSFAGRVNAQLDESPPGTYAFIPPQPLAPSTRYFWRVVSRTFASDINPALIALSDIWSFTTVSATAARADFSLDGKPDLIWQREDGYLSAWTMNGTTLQQATLLNPGRVGDPNWRIAGTGDLNGDGRPEIIWQHLTKGLLSVWTMVATQAQDAYYLNPSRILSNDWRIVAVADMNRDQKADLIWQHLTDGWLAVWYMDGLNMWRDRLLSPGRISSNEWRIVGAADMNSDGDTDLVWQHTRLGYLSVWYMTGADALYADYLNPPSIQPGTWWIRSVIDINADGKPDLIWQHENGWISAWLMNGVNLVEAVYLNPNWVDPSWKIVGPR